MRSLVVTASRASGISGGLTYESGELNIDPGSLVQVPLRGKVTEGIVLQTGKAAGKEEFEVKPIGKVLSTAPLLSRQQVAVATWMASYYVCSLRHVLRVFLPPPPWRSLVPQPITEYTPGTTPGEPRGSRQREIVAYVRAKGKASATALRYSLKATLKTVRSLVEKGFLVEHKRWREEDTAAPVPIESIPLPTLTPAQQTAFGLIVAEKRPTLLFGITGSGKTEVYAHLIAQTVHEGGQAILLVPEILLTEQSIARFKSLLPADHIAVLHSRLLPGVRRAEWRRIHSGSVSLVIGSRSALFAPLHRLKLIIIDEEHEWTYKNEQTPRYHARETAEMLAGHTGAKLVFGTATPSLEAWSRIKSGRYGLARIEERYLGRAVPTVRIIDLATANVGKHYPFTTVLLEAIHQRLQNGEQSVLFLNRRGLATALLCLECRRRVLSPDSALPFTLHRTPQGQPFLLDHTSGAMTDIPLGCPSCGSKSLRPVGAGTQKLEDTLAEIFPTARLIRADSDTLYYPEQMRELLRRMHEHEADILLGTQAVVKGLDLPSVTLAAVMVADVGLSLPHFRAGERIFQLLTQLTGRSGRAKPGEVIIQTFRPDAPEIVAASLHRTEKYLEDEMALRVRTKYPPAVPMIRLILDGPNAAVRTKQLHTKLRAAVEERKLDAAVTSAPTFFGGGNVWHILLRGQELRSLLPLIQGFEATIDVDPVDTL